MQRYLPILQTETFYTMCSGGLGHSMPAAVGVALARPDQKVIALIGDGSSLYSIQALWSAAQLKLPITFIILKNGRYASGLCAQLRFQEWRNIAGNRFSSH